MQIASPFFSIIIPTYNRGHLISRTISSILNQQFQDFEIIVVDDGGTDNTKQVVQDFSDTRIKYFWKENAERGAARNFGLSFASGSWINFFDSDDIAYPNHLQTAYNYIKSDTGIKVFHTSYNLMDIHTGKIMDQAISKGKLNKRIRKNNCLSCNNVFIIKKIAEEYKFSENRDLAGSEDWLLWLLLSKEFTIIGLPEITSSIVLHSGRSMVTALGKGTETRAISFIGTLKTYPNLGSFRSNIIGEFYSLAALCYSVEKKKKDALRCSFIAIRAKPLRIFSRRFLATVKHLI